METTQPITAQTARGSEARVETQSTNLGGRQPAAPAHGPSLAHLGDLHPLTVGAWIISSRALKPSSCPEELTTTKPILWGILGTGLGTGQERLL